jgi:hypothetical protein
VSVLFIGFLAVTEFRWIYFQILEICHGSNKLDVNTSEREIRAKFTRGTHQICSPEKVSADHPAAVSLNMGISFRD